MRGQRGPYEDAWVEAELARPSFEVLEVRVLYGGEEVSSPGLARPEDDDRVPPALQFATQIRDTVGRVCAVTVGGQDAVAHIHGEAPTRTDRILHTGPSDAHIVVVDEERVAHPYCPGESKPCVVGAREGGSAKQTGAHGTYFRQR